jgi:hypothetical protein
MDPTRLPRTVWGTINGTTHELHIYGFRALILMPNYELSINYSCDCTVVLTVYCMTKKDKGPFY